MHKFEHWVIACLVLTALAAFFKFCFRGYTYISVTLLFIAALIVVFISEVNPLSASLPFSPASG